MYLKDAPRTRTRTTTTFSQEFTKHVVAQLTFTSIFFTTTSNFPKVMTGYDTIRTFKVKFALRMCYNIYVVRFIKLHKKRLTTISNELTIDGLS